MKIGYIPANIFAFALYLIALASHDNSFVREYILAAIGVFFLFVATPLAFFQVLKIRSFSILEKYFSFLVFYFFVYSPIFFLLNQSIGIKISIENILIANLFIFCIALVTTKFKSGDIITLELRHIFNQKNALIFSALIGFFLLHAFNYHFYHFMPEWDGYTDIIKIENGLELQSVAQGYRGFFYTAVSVLSAFSGIQPYAIFTVIFIALQTSFLLVLSRLISLLDIREKSIETIIYLLALSVPVINMEIDMTRPQNTIIIFLPILVYFIFRFFTDKTPAFLVLSIIIAIEGMNYHEFFVFPLLTYAAWTVVIFIRKALSPETPREQRINAALLTACFALASILAIREIGALQGTITTAWNIILHISDTSSWRLWFVGSYSSDGANLQMGWPGIAGATKYYAYYLSPALTFLSILAILMLVRKEYLICNHLLIRIISPLLLVLFSFAEILPRLNHLYLPERFWLLIDILLIFISIPLLVHIKKRYSQYSKHILTAIAVFCLIGIFGSIYIATQKMALTSESEYRAALWIKENTPSNSLFMSQSASGPMINFFAKRRALMTDPEYFLSEKILEQNPDIEISRLQQATDIQIKEIDFLVGLYTNNELSFFEFADEIQKRKSALKKTEKEVDLLEKSIDQPKYVVYSFDKFDTLYSQREWWMLANAYGANIEKFNQAYPLVYHDGGVYIWKVR